MSGLVEGLKTIIAVEESTREEVAMVVESTAADDKLRDSFLDDPETDLAGVDDDPEIERLINQLPEYDPKEKQMEQKINSALESIY